MKYRFRKLEIDFRRGARGTPWAGRVLLLAAAAVALDTGLAYRDARQLIDANKAALARAQPGAPAPRASKEEVALARETVDRLAMPWNGLFGALEAAAGELVALLGVEPDPKAGKVTITGESKDYLAALTYVLNLSRSEALSHVELLRNDGKQTAPGSGPGAP